MEGDETDTEPVGGVWRCAQGREEVLSGFEGCRMVVPDMRSPMSMSRSRSEESKGGKRGLQFVQKLSTAEKAKLLTHQLPQCEQSTAAATAYERSLSPKPINCLFPSDPLSLSLLALFSFL